MNNDEPITQNDFDSNLYIFPETFKLIFDLLYFTFSIRMTKKGENQCIEKHIHAIFQL